MASTFPIINVYLINANKLRILFRFVDSITSQVTDTESEKITEIGTIKTKRSAEEEWVASENGDEWEEWLLMPQDEVYFVCTFIDACTKWFETDDYVHPLCGLHPSKCGDFTKRISINNRQKFLMISSHDGVVETIFF